MTNNTDPVRAPESMTGELLPCPFCGHTDQDRWPCEWLDSSGANVIRCAWCHGAAPADVWNRRALASAPPSGGGSSESDAVLLARLGDDAQKWAQEFRATAIKLGYSDMDEGWLIGWFANAIEHSSDVRRWRAEAAPPSAPGLLADLETIWHSVSDDGETNAAYQRLQAALAQQVAAPSGEAVISDPVYRAGYAQGVSDSRTHECACARTVAVAAPQQAAGVDEAWRQKAAAWLEAKAVEQEANNQRWPDHAAAYKEWRDRPGVLRDLAAQVLAAQQQEGE